MTDQKTTPQSSEKLVKKRLDELKPFENNSRTHSDAQIAQIVASIVEWGFTIPVLIDEVGMIIAGHGRFMAAQLMELESIPCIVAKGWTEAQKRAYVIADNKLTENGGWDTELLRLEMQDLDGLEFNMGLIGFDEAEMASLFYDSDEAEPPVDFSEVGETELTTTCPKCGFEFDE